MIATFNISVVIQSQSDSQTIIHFNFKSLEVMGEWGNTPDHRKCGSSPGL